MLPYVVTVMNPDTFEIHEAEVTDTIESIRELFEDWTIISIVQDPTREFEWFGQPDDEG